MSDEDWNVPVFIETKVLGYRCSTCGLIQGLQGDREPVCTCGNDDPVQFVLLVAETRIKEQAR
jgi:hypothetical protein